MLLMRHRFGATLPKLRELTGAARVTVWRGLTVRSSPRRGAC